MAIVPFATGTTVFTLGQGSDEESFRLVNVVFANGLVNGVPYNWNKWNDVTIQLSPLTRNYVLTVNGVQGGPFPFADPCGPIYGCSSTLVWHELRGSVTDDNDVGWIDTFRISADSPVLMIENTFDSYCGGAVFDGIGGLVTARPPVKFGH
jgi:hypothetical protein